MNEDELLPTPDMTAVIVDGNEFKIDSLNIWKEIRIGNIVAEILELLPNLIGDLQAWELERVKASEQIITPEDIAEGAAGRDELLKFLEEAGSTAEDIIDAGPRGVLFSAPVSDAERYIFLAPKLWLAASQQLSRLFALVTVPNSDLRNAENEFDREKLVVKQAEYIELYGTGEELIPLGIVSFGVVANEVRKVVEVGKSPKTTALLQAVGANVGLLSGNQA